MNKELEALERTRKKLAKHCNDIYEWSSIEDDLDIIETALKRLNYIDENRLSDEDIHIVQGMTFEDKVECIKKLKALEIITNKIKIEFTDHFLGIKGNYYIIVNNDVLGAIKVDKEKYDLLKEVLL